MPYRRIVVTTGGRFYYGELAHGLAELGLLERFYSGYPRFRLPAGLPPDRVDPWLWAIVPYFALLRVAPDWRTPLRLLARWVNTGIDRHAARTLPDCDLYAALSGGGLEAGMLAQSRGARYVCERAGAHIRWADERLRAESERLGIPFVPSDPVMIEREEAEYRVSDLLVAPSKVAAQTFVDHGVDARRIVTVPPVLPISGFPEPSVRPDRFGVLFVGSMSLIKGIRHLARAWQLAGLRDADLTFVGGANPDTETLLVPVKGLPHRRLGRQPRNVVLQEMRRAHVVVCPSVTDGHPMVAFEAMACGATVIVSDECGASEYMQHGVDGFVVPTGDPEAIAELLVELEGDRERVAEIGRAARERAHRMLDTRNYAERWYDTVVSGLQRIDAGLPAAG